MGSTRRELVKGAALMAAMAHVRGLSAFERHTGEEVAVDAAKETGKDAFQALPLGAVRPQGWLLRQMRTQADGLSGHLDEFWPDLGPDSVWRGGTGENWERGPYFLDGLLPLAYQLDDERLKSKVRPFLEWMLTHQAPNGMIGPASNDDWWPRMVAVKVLAQHYEATADPRVIPLLTRYFHYQLTEMPKRPLQSWGKYRWQDEAMVVLWLHGRTQDPKLLELAAMLKQQGYDWTSGFANFQYTMPTTRDVPKTESGGPLPERAMQSHGVNNGQAVKVAAVQYRMSGSAAERANYKQRMAMLDRYHGVPNGMFSCDEHLAGTDPVQGTELCTVVEMLFSLEVLLSTFGDADLADRLEKIAYNALPGTFDDAMWAHQYDQQSNQVQCSLNSKPWSTNGPESNLYGLEPNYGCCTANFHQGWPKLTTHLWMRGPADAASGEGLVAAMYAPCSVRTKVRGIDVQVEEETDYPFRDTVTLRLAPAAPLEFPLILRTPGWAAGATVRVNGEDARVTATPSTFAAVTRRWKAGDVVELKFPMQPRTSRWFHESITVERGPLVFSLDPGQSWVELRKRGQTADWKVFPTSVWNYGLAVDERTASALKVDERPVGAKPFAATDAAVTIQVPAHRLDSWRSEDGVAQTLPQSPVAVKTPLGSVTLIPYAAAKLRVTAFPQIKLEG
jgi:uncharacterized protein